MSNITSLVRTTSQPDQNTAVTGTAKLSSLQSPAQVSPSTPFSTSSPRFALTSHNQQTSKSPTPSSPIARSSKTAISSPNPSTPGKWQHPRLDEVIKRQEKTRFDRDNVAVISRNSLAIVASFAITWAVGEYVFAFPRLSSVTSWSTWSFWSSLYALFWSCRLLLLANVVTAVVPLFRTPDTCEDIPLDPSQRKLLGLPPMSRPATPQEKDQWVTPPRFSRNNTPLSTTSSLQVNASDSPFGTSGSAALDSSTQFPTSPFTPSSFGSSFLRGGDIRRRLSYTSNRSSPLSIDDFEAAGNNATPTKNNRASVGLNNKWLYEKGRASPRSSIALS